MPELSQHLHQERPGPTTDPQRREREPDDQPDESLGPKRGGAECVSCASSMQSRLPTPKVRAPLSRPQQVQQTADDDDDDNDADRDKEDEYTDLEAPPPTDLNKLKTINSRLMKINATFHHF